MNTEAIYEKGLLYRQTGQIKAALELFKSLMNNEGCSLVLLAKVYEQAAFCSKDLMARHDGKYINNFVEDMKVYLKKSVEISCSMVAKLPDLSYCWKSTLTLESFLLSERRSVQNYMNKELAFLKKMVKASKDIIDVFQTILVKVGSEVEKAEMYIEVSELYRNCREFDNAAIILGILTCRPAFHGHVEKKLYIEVNIEGAIDVFKRGDRKCAHLRINNALDFCRRKCTVSKSAANKSDLLGYDGGTSKHNFEILILCDPDNEENGKKILTVLEHFGVKITLNKRDTVNFDKSISEVYEDIVKQSNHILIVYDFEHTKKEKTDRKLMSNVEMMKRIIHERGHGNFLTLISTKTEQSEVPELLGAHQSMVYNFEDEENEMKANFDTIKRLLMCLAIGD